MQRPILLKANASPFSRVVVSMRDLIDVVGTNRRGDAFQTPVRLSQVDTTLRVVGVVTGAKSQGSSGAGHVEVLKVKDKPRTAAVIIQSPIKQPEGFGLR